jgi:hypothetical protein
MSIARQSVEADIPRMAAKFNALDKVKTEATREGAAKNCQIDDRGEPASTTTRHIENFGYVRETINRVARHRLATYPHVIARHGPHGGTAPTANA